MNMCRWCLFWHRIGFTSEGNLSRVGQCRRYPPSTENFPEVESYEWCGEFANGGYSEYERMGLCECVASRPADILHEKGVIFVADLVKCEWMLKCTEGIGKKYRKILQEIITKTQGN